MLHQIRKMIAVVVGIARNIIPEEMINEAFKTMDKLEIPTAPSLGLCLCHVRNFITYLLYYLECRIYIIYISIILTRIIYKSFIRKYKSIYFNIIYFNIIELLTLLKSKTNYPKNIYIYIYINFFFF